ncbi:MAG: ABC transporter [Gammaproteobacteria bacterium]|nr:MAG: ABC transporter [Gammaproteobacteria bacterium]
MVLFLSTLRDTLKDIFTDTGVLLILVIAPVVYAFYYPMPYSNEIVRRLPVAIVDHAQDSLSRKIIRMASAAPAIEVRVVNDERQAWQELINNKVMAFMIIPANLKRNITNGKACSVNMIGNGGYLLASKSAQQAMAGAVLTLSAGIEIKRLTSLAQSVEQINAIRDPVPLRIQPLHNPNEGYSSYVVPAVAWLILQQTLLIGCALLVSTWWERDRAYAPPVVWLGRLSTVSLLHYLVCMGYTGMMFSFWGYKTGANPWGNLLLISIFSPCVASLGCLLGLLIKDREQTMQILIFTALPMYFISGFSWPTQSLPEFLQYLRWVLPSTPVIQAGISFNQLGGTVADNRQYLIALTSIALISLALLFWFGRERHKNS